MSENNVEKMSNAKLHANFKDKQNKMNNNQL